MGIDRYMKKITAKDVAVYWGSPTLRSDGSNSYTTPVEIPVLWKGKVDLVRDDMVKEAVVRGIVYVTEDVDEQGILYHGCLSDLTETQKADPRKVKGAVIITRFLKVPSMLLKGEYNRSVYIEMF